MNSLNFEHEPLARSLKFSGDRMLVELIDGVVISVPLHHYPSLKQMPAGHREKWSRIGPGVGFHWPDYDLDLSVRGMLEGRHEHVPGPAYRKKHPRPIDLKKRVARSGWKSSRSGSVKVKGSPRPVSRRRKVRK